MSGIIGLLYTGAGVGTLIGPWLAGVAFDRFGSYAVPLVLGALCSFVAVACTWMIVEEKQILHRGQ